MVDSSYLWVVDLNVGWLCDDAKQAEVAGSYSASEQLVSMESSVMMSQQSALDN